ncbi:nuclease-related domain-containing protein, partial [Carnobacterium sp.]|uniref:nuclease-related domain-containing protein n=1 Tax=Carnobacterium sp. TaxID=48221 RepID=UPI0028B01962
MIIKKRTKPLLLQMLESLNYRTVLSASEKRDYYNQLKGYKGEVEFDSYLEKVQFDCLILNDLLLKEQGKMVQIDSLVLVGDTIYLYEVKNYSGNYDYKDDALHAQSGFVVTDPLTQIHNSQPFLYNLVRKLGYRMEIRSQ